MVDPETGLQDPARRPQPRDWDVRNCGIVRAMATRVRRRAEESSRAEQSVQAFRDALEKSVTISRDRLQEVVDDAVRRGRMTRGDAEEMVGRLVTRGREQAEDLLAPARAAPLPGPRGARPGAAGGRRPRQGGPQAGRRRGRQAARRRRPGAPGGPGPGLPDHRLRPALGPSDRPPAAGAQPRSSCARSATTSAATRPARALLRVARPQAQK